MSGLFSVVFIAAVVGLVWSGCIPGWTEYDGSCYRCIVQWPKTWGEAEDYCNEIAFSDGHLVSIGSEDEQTWVFNWWVSMLPAFETVDESQDLVMISQSGGTNQDVEEPINGSRRRRRGIKGISRRARWALPPHRRHPNCRHLKRERSPTTPASGILDKLVTIAPEIERDVKFVWIGFRDREDDGSWDWSDGTNTNFTFWRGENPRERLPDDDDCAMMMTMSAEGPGLWEISICSRKRAFLCEYRAPNITGGMC